MATDLGVCQLTAVGRLMQAPVIVEGNEDDRSVVVDTVLVAVRRVRTGNNGDRAPHENVIDIRATGAAAQNLLKNYSPGKKCFVSGELTVYADSVVLHLAQLLWL
jgi:single-stranded DNA-binding protein